MVAGQDILRVEGKHIVRLTYVADIGDEPVVLDSENTEFKWVTNNELHHLDGLDPYLGELVKSGGV